MTARRRGYPATVSDVARYWDEQASSFDEAPDHGLRDAAVRFAWASLLTPLMPPAPAQIADLGCGTGNLAILLAEAGHIVSGIDVAAGMVTRARDKAAAAGVDAEFEVGDAMTPPWPGATFDVVMARHVVWALPDPARGLGRWFELLKPGGRVVLIEGRWWTGAGLAADELLELVREHGRRPPSSTGSAGIRRCPGRALSPGRSAPLAPHSARSARSLAQAGP